MITIYKYPIVDMVNEFELPQGAQIIKADYDPIGEMCIWAAVDTQVETETVKILKIGTHNDTITLNAKNQPKKSQFNLTEKNIPENTNKQKPIT